LLDPDFEHSERFMDDIRKAKTAAPVKEEVDQLKSNLSMSKTFKNYEPENTEQT
jgi:hypothetical protein